MGGVTYGSFIFIWFILCTAVSQRADWICNWHCDADYDAELYGYADTADISECDCRC